MASDPYNPNYEYVAYIDEAGETGLKNVLGIDDAGSSEWFILSLLVARKSDEPLLGQWVAEIMRATKSHQMKNLHFRNLLESQKIAATKILATKPVKAFVICSNKKNMRQYRNKRAEKMGVKDWYYCWLTRTALERATNFVWRRSVQQFNAPRFLKVVFGERGGLRVGQLGAYYHWIKQQSRNDNLYLKLGDIEWETLHPRLLTKDFAKNLDGLKLADIVASAFYAACDFRQSGPCRPHLAENLKPIIARFPNNDSGRYSGYGVKLLPSYKGAKLTDQQQVVFLSYGYPQQLWQEGRRWELPPPREEAND
jgi:hypothetical protein